MIGVVLSWGARLLLAGGRAAVAKWAAGKAADATVSIAGGATGRVAGALVEEVTKATVGDVLKRGERWLLGSGPGAAKLDAIVADPSLLPTALLELIEGEARRAAEADEARARLQERHAAVDRELALGPPLTMSVLHWARALAQRYGADVDVLLQKRGIPLSVAGLSAGRSRL